MKEKVFDNSHWVCENGHKFGFGEAKSPHKCPECGSTVFKFMPEIGE